MFRRNNPHKQIKGQAGKANGVVNSGREGCEHAIESCDAESGGKNEEEIDPEFADVHIETGHEVLQSS